MRVAGIDQGTTSTKGLVVEDAVVAELPARTHAQRHPRPGWVEHDAGELLANVIASIDDAAAQGAAVIGLANQGETVVAWDRDSGRPLGPAIVWQDNRTADAVAALAQDGRSDEVATIAGLPLDCYFSASKLRWLLDHVDGAREVARRGRLGLGTSDSFFLEHLTGRYVTDATTASRTSLMNLSTGAWDERLCELFGVPLELLPGIADDSSPLGDVRTTHGLVRLASSAVDQVAALYGHGCRSPGDGKVTIGTGAFALIVTGEGRPARPPAGSVPTAGWRTLDGRTFAVDGGVYSAASAVDWLGRLGLLADIRSFDPEGPTAAERGLYFVPALAGLAFPHWDRSASGLFIGLDAASTATDLTQAVLEGVAFRVAELLDGLGFSADRPVPVDGGLARSRYFTRVLADFSGRPLQLRVETEVTSLGVAQLAAAVADGRPPGSTRPAAFAGETLVEGRMSPDAVVRLRQRFSHALERSRGWRN